MNRRTILLAAGAAAFTRFASAAPSTKGFALAGELDAVIPRAMARLGVAPGLSVAVYSREGTYTRGFGVTDVTTREVAHADTAFYIASSTKPLTALALSAKAARGEIDLGATLTAFAPDAAFPAAVRAGEVTLRDLLTHVSGIENNPIVFRVAFSGQHDPGVLWRLLGASSVNAKAPLGTFEYTNAGYNIATVLTDHRFRQPWQDMLDRDVFGPAGMTHATARMSRAQSGRWSVAKPHMALPEGVRRIYLEKTDQTMQSAGGVIMSANDAVRWLELMVEDGMIAGRRVLPAAAVEATRARIATVGGEFAGYAREAYGLGWYHGPHRGEAMLHHFGGFAGARAHVSYIPARRIGVAAFVNESTAAAQLTDAVANFVYDRTAGRADAPAVFEAAIESMITRRDQMVAAVLADRAKRAGRAWTLTRARAAYAGSYENETFGRIDVTVAGESIDVAFGALKARAEPFTAPDSIRVELKPSSGEVMLFDGADAQPAALMYDRQRYARV